MVQPEHFSVNGLHVDAERCTTAPVWMHKRKGLLGLLLVRPACSLGRPAYSTYAGRGTTNRVLNAGKRAAVVLPTPRLTRADSGARSGLASSSAVATAESTMSSPRASSSIHWFRKGLRLHDNRALLEACDLPGSDGSLYPLFVLDSDPASPESRAGSLRYDT